MQVQQLYAEITARIIEGLEQGVKPWQRGWDADVPLTLPAMPLPARSTVARMFSGYGVSESNAVSRATPG